MSSLDPPQRKSTVELIEEHRELFEDIAAMDDEHPEFAQAFGKDPLAYLTEHGGEGDD